MPTKNVIVLMDDESRRSELHNKLGKTIRPLYLCMQRFETEVFTYQIYGLMVADYKLSDFIKTRDGIVILLDYAFTTSATLSAIEKILTNNPNKPTMIFIENCFGKTINSELVQKLYQYNGPHIKVFGDINIKPTEKLSYDDPGPVDNSLNWFNKEIKKLEEAEKESKKKVILVNQGNKYTSKNIKIMDMVKLFENCTLPIELWDHYGRLRIVHYSIRKYGFNDSINQNGWLCTNWKKYKTSIGHGDKWHYTLTRFWINIISQLNETYDSFEKMYAEVPMIQRGNLFKDYYSDDIIANQYARNNWIAPNLKQTVHKN